MSIVWQITALHLTNNRTLVTGVLLNKNPSKFTDTNSGLRNLLKVLKSYFIKSYANKPITIRSNGDLYQTNTDSNGSFKLITKTLHKNTVSICCNNSKKPLPIVQTYPVIFKTSKSSVALISDIDDTIIVSNTASFIKRVLTTALKPPQKRKLIPYTQQLLNMFNNLEAPIYYVSKSESNLFNLITHFIQHNNLPEGALFLTPFLKFFKLFNSKKDFNFKIDHISFLIKNTNTKKYVLLGDDSQRDMAIYAETVKAFPNKILKIYIRQTKETVLPHQKKMMTHLTKLNIPITYFRSDDNFNIKEELKHLGL